MRQQGFSYDSKTNRRLHAALDAILSLIGCACICTVVAATYIIVNG